MVARLDEIMAGIADGRIEVPTTPTGLVLTFDVLGNEVDRSVLEEETFGAAPVGVDGLAQYAAIEPGTYKLGSLGTPVTITIDGDWWVQPNIAGHTVFSHPDSSSTGDRDAVLLRPTFIADPTQPGAPVDEQVAWSLDDIDGWLDEVVDGIVTSEPEATQFGGRDAVYFEVEITNEDVCGTSGYCAGFIINTIDDDGISGWSFEPGFHQRVWWVDGGDHEPLVIIASTPSDDSGLSFQSDADQLLGTIQIGDPQPHPVPNPGT
jgi:hypothetical protein